MICGKTIYPTMRLAIEAIKGMMKKLTNAQAINEPSKAYFCHDCKGYHLYSESKNKSKRLKTKQSKNQETSSESITKKENDKKFKDLIIHNPRKFKVK